MDPYEALREYDAEYRREELELAQIQDEIKAVRLEINSEEKGCVALEAESLQLDRDIENAELRRAAIAAKMESVRKEEEKIMPELMKRREKIEKQERMRAAMETAIRKRAEFVDKMVADYKTKIYGLPRMTQYMQVKHEIEELEHAVEEKKKNIEHLKDVIRVRKEKETQVWEEFKKLCIQGAKNWKRASEEAKKKEEEASMLQQRKKLAPPNAGPPRYSWMSQSAKPKLAAFSRTKLGSSPFSFYKKPETNSSSLLRNLTQPTRKGSTDDGFLANIDQQAEQFIRTSAKEREALLSRATERLYSRFSIGNIDSILSEQSHNRDQGPSPNEAKAAGRSPVFSPVVANQGANTAVVPKEAKTQKRVSYAPLPTSEEYPLPVLEKHMKERFSRPNSVASVSSHDRFEHTAAQKPSQRCRSAVATSITSTASIGTTLARYANKMDTDDGKKPKSATPSKSLEHNIHDSPKDAPNYTTFDNYMSSQDEAGGSNYDNGGFFAEIQQDAGLPAFGYSDENMDHEGEGDHPFGRNSPPAEFDFPNPFA